MEKIYTVPELAEYLSISRAKLYRMIQNNEIPHIRIGRNVRVRESDLMSWLEELTAPYEHKSMGLIPF